MPVEQQNHAIAQSITQEIADGDNEVPLVSKRTRQQLAADNKAAKNAYGGYFEANSDEANSDEENLPVRKRVKAKNRQ